MSNVTLLPRPIHPSIKEYVNVLDWQLEDCQPDEADIFLCHHGECLFSKAYGYYDTATFITVYKYKGRYYVESQSENNNIAYIGDDGDYFDLDDVDLFIKNDIVTVVKCAVELREAVITVYK